MPKVQGEPIKPMSTHQTPENPPAFPIPSVNTSDGLTIVGTIGMTLRDYFAAKAMEGMLAYQPADNIAGMSEINAVYFATRAYEFADAMLKARQTPNQ